MIKRLRGWWQQCLLLAVIWTVAVAAYAWINLPRAGQIPHDSGLITKLSDKARSILSGHHARAESTLDSLIWTKARRVVRMPNGAPVSFPAMTTTDHVAIVRGEYARLLNIEAKTQAAPFLLGIAAFWLLTSATLFIAGWIVGRLYRGRNAVGGKVSGQNILRSASKAPPASFPMRHSASATGAGITTTGSARARPDPDEYRFAA